MSFTDDEGDNQSDEQSLQQSSSAVLEVAFASAKDSLVKYRKSQIAQFHKMLSVVRSLRKTSPRISDQELASWLVRETGMSAYEAKIVADFEAKLGRWSHIIKTAGLSIDVVAELLRSDENTIDECFARIHRGEVIDSDVVTRIRRRREVTDLSPEEARAKHRAMAFEAAGASVGAKLSRELSEGSAALLGRIGEIVRLSRFDGHVIPEHRLEISESANRLRALFENLFGCPEQPREETMKVMKNDRLAGSILWAWYALQDLAGGDFHLLELYSCAFGRDMPAALRFLAGHTPVIDSVGFFTSIYPNVPKRPLRVVDINAGLGSASLGLETAGFFPTAVYEASPNLRKIMKANRSVWNLRGRPFPTDDDVKVLDNSFDDVALVTSGTIVRLPRLVRGAGSDTQESFLVAELSAVAMIKPKAFIFGIDDRVLSPASSSLKDSLDSKVRSLGFEPQWHVLDTVSLGVPQEEELVVLVGLSPSLLTKWDFPLIVSPVKQTLADAISNLIRRPEGGKNRAGDHKLFLEWLKCWKEEQGSRPAPPFYKGPQHTLAKADWEKIGISIHAVQPSSAAWSLGTPFVLTSEMMARIRGIPPLWKLDSATSLPARYLRDALPPAVAKAVGLAIYNAISGTNFDINDAMTEPPTLPLPILKQRYPSPGHAENHRGPRRYRRLS